MFLKDNSETFHLLKHNAVELEISQITFCFKIIKCDWNFLL